MEEKVTMVINRGSNALDGEEEVDATILGHKFLHCWSYKKNYKKDDIEYIINTLKEDAEERINSEINTIHVDKQWKFEAVNLIINDNDDDNPIVVIDFVFRSSVRDDLVLQSQLNYKKFEYDYSNIRLRRSEYRYDEK